MEDIAPQLIQAVTDEFHRLYDSSSKIQTLLAKVKKGTATYAEAQEYAIEVSRLIGVAYEKHVSSATLPDGKMYYNIASRLIPDTLDENYKLVSQYAADVQTKLNQNAGINLKAQTADREQDRIDGLVELASNADQYDDIEDRLLSAFENFSQHIVDSTIQKNADFHYRSGLSPKIIRRAEPRCCKWCRSLAGEYRYPDTPKDVYRRHERCRCVVTYDPGNGRRQNVHTKRWSTSEEEAKAKSRQLIGTRAAGTTVKGVSSQVRDHLASGNVTIEGMQKALSSPMEITDIQYDRNGRPYMTFVGQKATITVNPKTGIILTAYPTHSSTATVLKEQV